MNVAVVGAGISGLSAARELVQAGKQCTVFEIENVVGGRCATEKIGSFIFDPGATSIAPRGMALEKTMLQELSTNDLVEVSLPIHMHEALRVSPGDPVKNSIRRYTYLGGNRRLAELLSTGLNLRLGVDIASLEKGADGKFRLAGEVFDAVVLTPPAPIAASLLASIGEVRPIAHVKYRSCISIMLGYELATPSIGYHAIIDPEQRHPLTWLSVENAKCPDRAPEGCTSLVCQMSPTFSQMHFDDQDEVIVDLATVYLERLFGSAWRQPSIFKVKRWKHSQPEMTSMFDSANLPGSRIVLAGDGFAGARVEFAYESGLRAARLLMQR